MWCEPEFHRAGPGKMFMENKENESLKISAKLVDLEDAEEFLKKSAIGKEKIKIAAGDKKSEKVSMEVPVAEKSENFQAREDNCEELNLQDYQLELENRIRNLLWTISGDYTQQMKPDVSLFLRSKDIALYDGIKQGALAKFFDKDFLGMYLVKKIFMGADEAALTFVSQLCIEEAALHEIIAGYTKEAGVRSLERRIGEICRKTARKILEEKEETVTVNKENLENFLGRARYTYQKKNETDEVGIVRGLAWTSVGGDTLQIEVNLMPGKGDFLLTGQLGDVMKESAQTGISYIRSVAEKYHIDADFFKEHDIHIHIPEGAVPKDGPSAGITMATAMLSAITEVPVKADVAMTGEITLRGRVLPIGGLKEKLLAAKSAGIEKVLIPFENQADVEEMEKEITEGLEIVPVKTMEEVLKQAFAEKK